MQNNLVFLIGMVPATVFAAVENGYNLATATSRPYDGTAIVQVTDMVFSGAYDTDDVSADAVGTLSSADAATYTVVNLSDIVLKGVDAINYDLSSLPNGMPNVPTSVTISKVDPIIDLTVSPSDTVTGRKELLVTVIITNNFNYNDGLPAADELDLSVQNAILKPGTSVDKNGNVYTATYVVADAGGSDVQVSVNIADSAINYNRLNSSVTTTLPIVGAIKAPESKPAAVLSTKTDSNVPATGDTSNMVLWTALLLALTGGVSTLTLKRRSSAK